MEIEPRTPSGRPGPVPRDRALAGQGVRAKPERSARGSAVPASAVMLGMLLAGRAMAAPAADEEPGDATAPPAAEPEITTETAAASVEPGATRGADAAVVTAAPAQTVALPDDAPGSDADRERVEGGAADQPRDAVLAPSGNDAEAVTTPAPGTTEFNLTQTEVNFSTDQALDEAPSEEGEDPDEGLEAPGDYVEGSAGEDVIFGTALADTIDGGEGNDTIRAGAGGDTVRGAAGNDRLYGEEGDDLLQGGPGDDLLDGGPGDDRLEGGDGDDTLRGAAGDDLLDGGDGNDLLDGGAGKDTMFGGPGDDVIRIDSLADTAFGGQLSFDQGIDTLVVTQGYTADFARLYGSADTLTFAFGDRFGERLPDEANPRSRLVDPSFENLTLEGDADIDIVGGDGDNVLRGNAGDNRIWGYDGDDTLAGGDGTDLLYGGAGDDRYLVGLNDSGIDTIFDTEGANLLVLEDVADQAVGLELVGDDLHVFVGDEAVAVWSDYVGNEDALAGIDWGEGPVVPADLLAGSLAATQFESAANAEGGGDLLSAFLSEPASEAADATEDDGWLRGDDSSQPTATEAEPVAQSEPPMVTTARAEPVDDGAMPAVEGDLNDAALWSEARATHEHDDDPLT
jgi:Ca2+-binding RTX toxin-like protein